MLKMAKLEFENHKNQYFSWLLRSEQVKTNIRLDDPIFEIFLKQGFTPQGSLLPNKIDNSR